MIYKDNNDKKYIDCPLGLYDTETCEFISVIQGGRYGMDDAVQILELQVDMSQGDGSRIQTDYFRVMQRFSAQDIADCLAVHVSNVGAKR